MADARYDDFDAIEVLDEVDSTNEELMKRARAGAPEGTALRARVQQSGRGRRSHGWTSPEGGLYLSVLIKPKVPDRVLSGLPVACGIGVANALEQIGCEGVQLKWPNDVVTPKGKLGGILVELGRSSGEKLAVCGLGIMSPSRWNGAIRMRCPSRALLTACPKDQRRRRSMSLPR